MVVMDVENSVPMRGEIPNLPKTAKKLFSIWLYGCEEKEFSAVKLYDRGETIAAIIKHYFDIKWT